MSPPGTLSRRDPDCFSVQRNYLTFVSVFGKRLSGKSNTVIHFTFGFHVAVQQPFKARWSRLLVRYYEPSRVLFALCLKSLLMSLLAASQKLLLYFNSTGLLSSSGSCCLAATAGLAPKVAGTHKPIYHGKMETPLEENVLR